ncbi:MAG: 50S ribosomal protein L3 [bacterium]
MAEEKKQEVKAPEVGSPAILGTKIGMTQIFDEAGNVQAVTVVEAGPCVVTQLKSLVKDGYNAIQVGFGKAKKLNKPAKGHLKGANSRFIREIKVEKSEDFKVGQEIKAETFKEGELVNVTGFTIGKGFAGTIKKYHHSRGLMTHGSKSHRLTGSIGAGTTPGRVFKGRPMPGHMGNVQVTEDNVRVIKVDQANNLLLLSGGLPGKKGNLYMIRKVAA